jgi:hypothetical protein
MSAQSLTLADHTRLDLLLGPDDLCRGLGDVRVRGVPLRHGGVPLCFQLDTPDGILYTQWRLRAVAALPGGQRRLSHQLK